MGLFLDPLRFFLRRDECLLRDALRLLVLFRTVLCPFLGILRTLLFRRALRFTICGYTIDINFGSDKAVPTVISSRERRLVVTYSNNNSGGALGGPSVKRI